MFQIPANNPTALLTIRTSHGVHYLDKEQIALFVDRNAANFKIVSRLAERIPNKIDNNLIYQPSISDFFSNSRLSLVSLSSSAVTKIQRSKYSNTISWPENSIPEFIFVDDFDTYIDYISNFSGMRNKLSGSPIKLKLRISESGKFELVDIDSPFQLSSKNKERIYQFVNAFPLWIIDNKIENIGINLAIKQ